MKLKHSISGINSSLLQILFAVFTFAGVIVRTFQRFTQLESETGFYKEINLVNTFIMVLMILVPVIFIVVSFLSTETSALTFEKTESRGLFAVSLATSLGFVYDAVSSYFRISEAYDDYSGTGFNETPFIRARMIFALLSAVYMVLIAMKAKGKADKISKLFIIPLAPAVWSAVRLFPLFANEISYIQVSDLFSEIFMLVFATLFFFNLASAVTGIGFFGCSYKLVAYGFSTAFLCAVINVPKLIATVVNAEKYIISEYPLSAVDFMVFLFAVTSVAAVLKSEKNYDEILFQKENKED